MLRDPTRGGVATTLNEFVENRGFSIELEERAIPVAEGVASACEILGLDPLYCANEGKMLVIADRDAADEILAALHEKPGGEHAAVIGRVTTQYPGKSSTENVPGRDAHSGKTHRRRSFRESVKRLKRGAHMQTNKKILITKEEIIPTAQKMREEGRMLLLIHWPSGHRRHPRDHLRLFRGRCV